MGIPWGFEGAHGTSVRPPHIAATKEWAKDESQPGANDGTRLGSSIVNRLVGNIRALAAAAASPLTETSDEDLLQAVTALITLQVSAAVSGFAPLASPAFTGTPEAPTADPGTNTPQIATTAFVSAAVANLISSAPGALDTLAELAAALGDDENFAATITAALADKQPLHETLTALAALTTTGYGRALLELANEAALRALINTFTGDAGSGGAKGLVPAPAAGDAAVGKFLSAGGGFAVPTLTASSLAALPFGPFTDIVSAATCDLGSIATIGVNITGTTGITSFGTTGASLLRIVKFAGILTLTHNATSLILPTGANITTAVGDTLIALSDGSDNWTVVAYQRASGAALVSPTPASQAEAEGGSENTKMMTALRTRQAIDARVPQAALAKAWVNFNGVGTVTIRNAYNVTSITDNGTGDYTVNYSSAIGGTNAALAAFANVPASSGIAGVAGGANFANGTNSCRITVRGGSTTTDADDVCLVVFR